MTNSLSLQEDLKKQIDAGFTSSEIENNLLAKGYTKAQVQEVFSTLNVVNATAADTSGNVSTTSILAGVFFYLCGHIPFCRGCKWQWNIFILLGIFTAIGMSIYFFSKKR